MTDKKNQKTPKEVTKLSEWQRRNQEYQKKKQLEEQEEKEKKAQEEKERQELLNQKTPSEDSEADGQDGESEEVEKERMWPRKKCKKLFLRNRRRCEEEKIIYLQNLQKKCSKKRN